MFIICCCVRKKWMSEKAELFGKYYQNQNVLRQKRLIAVAISVQRGK